MSDLWMILVLLGVSVVLAVVVFNWWQEKKYRRDVEYRFSQTRVDVLDNEAPEADGKREPASKVDKHTVSEDMEGWMSEPRVRQTAKFEPSFNLGEPSKQPVAGADISDKAATPASNAEVKTGYTSATATTQALSQSTKPHTAPAQQATPAQRVTSAQMHAQQASPEAATLSRSPLSPPPIVSQEPLAFAASPDDDDLEDAVTPEQPQLVEAPQAEVAIPPALNIAMDLVGVIAAPLGVASAELEDLQAEIRTFPQHAALWALNGQAQWLDLLGLERAALQQQVTMTQVVCGLQLADRGGPVDADTLKRYQKSMDTLARQLGLQVEWQGDHAPAQQAQLIDAFCIEVDKAVEFHVLAGQGMFHATKLRGLAEASGLRLSEQGRFELLNNEGQLEFSVRNYEGKPFSADMLKTAVMTGVTFQLDIPTTPNNVQVFDHMIEVARGMAQSLGGNMIDVNRKPIGDPQLGKIRQQLNTISAAMAEKGILPGSSHAKRLFS